LNSTYEFKDPKMEQDYTVYQYDSCGDGFYYYESISLDLSNSVYSDYVDAYYNYFQNSTSYYDYTDNSYITNSYDSQYETAYKTSSNDTTFTQIYDNVLQSNLTYYVSYYNDEAGTYEQVSYQDGEFYYDSIYDKALGDVEY
jgi:hypothetical protein